MPSLFAVLKTTVYCARVPGRFILTGSAIVLLVPAALARPSERRHAAWYRDYLEALVQRDVRDLARIGSPDALPRLLALAASQTAHLLNVTDLASPFQLSPGHF